MLSTALKDLASELNIFVESATQITGEFESVRGIKGIPYLRGSKGIADKSDMGAITYWIDDNGKDMIKLIAEKLGERVPNYVSDIYKNRRSRYKNVKIWSIVDLGCCQVKDICMTDGSINLVEVNCVLKYEKLIADFPDKEKVFEREEKTPEIDLSIEREDYLNQEEIISTTKLQPKEKKYEKKGWDDF